jgi:hypothetical protein
MADLMGITQALIKGDASKIRELVKGAVQGGADPKKILDQEVWGVWVIAKC